MAKAYRAEGFSKGIANVPWNSMAMFLQPAALPDRCDMTIKNYARLMAGTGWQGLLKLTLG
jgi:hypothetical protein